MRYPFFGGFFALSALASLGCSSHGSSTSGGAGAGTGGLRATGTGGAAATTTAAASVSATSTNAGPGAVTGSSTSGGPTTTGSASTGSGSTGSGSCTTRITYGDTWIHGANHPDNYDDVMGPVTWDGACTNDNGNSYAKLSNGWKPYFNGNGGCVIAIDSTCGTPGSCATRISYGPSWQAAPNHPNSYDDVGERVMWNRDCVSAGGSSHADLTNGWSPYFSGSGACDLSFRYTDCGGLYENPIVPVDCPDPGVVKSGTDYVVACTSGGTPAFPMRTSKDLVHWTSAGHILPNGASWANGNYWAPEIHRVGSGFVAYFTAKDAGTGRLSVGAASASAATGPFTDIGHPLVTNPSMGVIDPDEFDDTGNGKHYVVWKVDGNAVGAPTPIYGQELSANGTSLVGSAVQLITNDPNGWEGPLVEGPWVYAHGGYYYLFYSANAYYNGKYAVGVARSQSPLGPYTKLGPPILTSDASFAGPGHCSVVDAPSGDTVMVYHSWLGSAVGGGPGRVMLVDQVQWANGWPAVRQAPSSHSRPMP